MPPRDIPSFERLVGEIRNENEGVTRIVTRERGINEEVLNIRDIGLATDRFNSSWEVGIPVPERSRWPRERGVPLLTDRGKTYVMLNSSGNVVSLAIGQNANRSGIIVAFIHVVDNEMFFSRRELSNPTQIGHVSMPVELCSFGRLVKIREVK